MLDDYLLKVKTDYTLTYHKAEDDSLVKKRPTTPGSYLMRVVGKGSCKGTFDFPFIVSEEGASDISKGKAFVGSMDYRGKYPDISLSVGGEKLIYDTDYKVRFSNTDAKGTATAAISDGQNGLYIANPPIVCEYQELSADKVITSVALNKKADGLPKKFEYTENGISLDKKWLTVKAGKYTLSSDEFEIIGYINNAGKGMAAVVVQGTGEYGGTKILNFKIQSHSLPSVDRWIVSLLE